MDSFELNKVAGAALGAVLFAVGSGFVAELIYNPKPAGTAGYALPEPQAKAGGASAAPEAQAEPLPIRLASASADKGQSAAKKCTSCHSFEKGGPNKVGPDLYGIVDRPRAHHEGFEYSAALKEKGGNWSYDELDKFLTNPKAYIAGTKMAFAGIASPTERADVISYLRTLADTPAALPVVDKKADAKPADTKAGDTKPAAESKPTEAKPEAKPAATPEAKPAAPPEPKAAEPKPADAPPSPAPDAAPATPAEKPAE
jgi:cytochrome c